MSDRSVNLNPVAHTTPHQINPPLCIILLLCLINCTSLSPVSPRLPSTAAAIPSLQACTISSPLAQASTAAALLCPLPSWLLFFFFHDRDRSVRRHLGRQLQRLSSAGPWWWKSVVPQAGASYSSPPCYDCLLLLPELAAVDASSSCSTEQAPD
jgi:hypothetical protein